MEKAMSIEEPYERIEEAERYERWLEWRMERDRLLSETNEDDYPERDDYPGGLEDFDDYWG